MAVPRGPSLDLGLSGLPRPDRLVVFGIDRPTHFSVHSASARLAPLGGATIHLMKYLEPDEAAEATGAEAELEAMADRIQPGWRDLLVTRRFLPKLVSSNALVTAGTRRPAIDAAGEARTYLAGDWIGEEGMLVEAAIASARAPSARVVADLARGDAGSSEGARASAPATMAAS